MQQLTSLDAGFLHAEDADRRTNLGIGGLAILDGPIPGHAALMSTLGERVTACPRFAQRLRRRPFDLTAPEWVDDAHFALAHHVHRVAVPAPGTDAELFPLVAELMSRRLDRDRPLWEIWVIDGLGDGRWAMLMKVHACVADAVATVHILTGLADEPGVGRPHPGSPACPAADGGSAPAGLWPMLRGAVGAAGQAIRGTAEVAAGLRKPASTLNGPITDRRRYSAARVALSDVRKVCRAFDVTVDDVALAALTESYRDMLLRRGERLRPDSLRALVPTQHAALLPYLPVEEENPVLRLRMVQARLARLQTAPADPGGTAIAAAAQLLPFPLTAWLLNLMTRLPQRTVGALAVHVPGPSGPLRVMGCDVVRVLPIPPLAMQLRTGVAMLGYADELSIGILADFDAVPDAAELARGIEAAVARLVARSKRRRAGRDRHGLSLVVSA